MTSNTFIQGISRVLNCPKVHVAATGLVTTWFAIRFVTGDLPPTQRAALWVAFIGAVAVQLREIINAWTEEDVAAVTLRKESGEWRVGSGVSNEVASTRDSPLPTPNSPPSAGSEEWRVGSGASNAEASASTSELPTPNSPPSTLAVGSGGWSVGSGELNSETSTRDSPLATPDSPPFMAPRSLLPTPDSPPPTSPNRSTDMPARTKLPMILIAFTSIALLAAGGCQTPPELTTYREGLHRVDEPLYQAHLLLMDDAVKANIRTTADQEVVQQGIAAAEALYQQSRATEATGMVATTQP